ncbi:MAG TPA: hypothetical protein VFF81_05610 [Noviherbaspirillum sp.]|nr:hypothetical protein [Noviherbaspirillum sp.]
MPQTAPFFPPSLADIMLCTNIPRGILLPRQLTSEVKTPKQFIQTHHDLACALHDKFGALPGMYLDKPDPDVGEGEIASMLDTISAWMEKSPGLRSEARLALVALTGKMKPEFDAKGLTGNMKEIIDTFKPEKFNTLQPYMLENIGTFLQQDERVALYSLNHATATKLKYERAHDLARTAKEAVISADKFGKWLSRVEHLDDKRCHAQLLGVAAIASNAVDHCADVEVMLRAALGKLGDEEKDQVTLGAYLDSAGRAVAQKSAVADWTDQWELAHQLDVDFQSQPFIWLTVPGVGPRLDKDMYVRKIDAAILQLDRLPVGQLAEAVNSLFFALQHFEGKIAIVPRLNLLEKAYHGLPELYRASALPGYANSISLAAEAPGKEADAWAIRTSPRFFDDVLKLASAENSTDNLIRIFEGLVTSMRIIDDRPERKLAILLTLSTKLSSTCRSYVLLRAAAFLHHAGKTALFETCFEAYVNELERTPIEAAEELVPTWQHCAKLLNKLSASQQEMLYSKVPSYSPAVKTQLFEQCFLKFEFLSAPMLRLIVRHLWELAPWTRQGIVGALFFFRKLVEGWQGVVVARPYHRQLDEYGLLMASHDFLDYFSKLPKDVQPMASQFIGTLIVHKVGPTRDESKQRINLCRLIAEYLARHPETAPSFDAFASASLEDLWEPRVGGPHSFVHLHRYDVAIVLSDTLERIPKDQRAKFRFKLSYLYS